MTNLVTVDAQAKPNAVKVIRVLGVPVSMTNMQEVVATITSWACNGKTNYVCIRDVHGVMQAQADPALLEIHEKAGLVTPDGMPLVWLGRLREGKHVGRVCGADLVDALCSKSIDLRLRHFFYGGKPGVAEKMAAALCGRFRGLQVAGTLSPPFETVPEAQDDAIVARIAEAAPHIVWVGLSTPKQEYWMRDHVARLPGVTLIGVGAAFDFHAGQVKRAPKWMQRSGLEWSHRLAMDPRRLWRRYVIMAPKFVFKVFLSQIRGDADAAADSGAK